MASSKPFASTVTTYRFPTSSRRTGTIICGILMLWSSRRPYIELGSYFYKYALRNLPASVSQYSTIVQNVVFYFLFGAHAIETIIFAATKLRKHGVNLLSSNGLRWILTAFVGGKFAIDEFDLLVAEKVS